MTGVIVLIAALVVAAAVGAAVRLRAGKVRSYARTDHADSPGTSPSAAGGRGPVNVVTADDLGASLGQQATLVQFSSAFCAYCGPTRKMLGELAAERPGVAVVEVDAGERMDLTRRFRVFSTPTVLVLGPGGTVAARSAGRPRKADLAESLGSVLSGGVRS